MSTNSIEGLPPLPPPPPRKEDAPVVLTKGVLATLSQQVLLLNQKKNLLILHSSDYDLCTPGSTLHRCEVMDQETPWLAMG
jgi:hypothetical protein